METQQEITHDGIGYPIHRQTSTETTSTPTTGFLSSVQRASEVASETYSDIQKKRCCATFWTQVGLLLWKNILVHIRKPTSLLIHCLFPSCFALVLFALKLTAKKVPGGPYHYNETSANSLAFWKDGTYGNTVGYFPGTPATTDVMTRAMKIHNATLNLDLTKGRGKEFTIKDFSYEKEAIAFFEGGKVENNMIFIIEFKHLKVDSNEAILPKDITIIIHPFRGINNFWNTKQTFQYSKDSALPRDDYQNFPLAYVQTLVAKATTTHWMVTAGQNATRLLDIFWRRFSGSKVEIDAMYTTLKEQLTLFQVLAFLLIAFVDTKNLVQEKESKLKESFKLMGMKLSAYWLSWFITNFIFILPTLVVFSVILGVDFGVTGDKGSGPILADTAPSMIFCGFLCYSFALIGFSFMMSSIVQKGNDGMILSGILFLVIYTPYEVLVQSYQTFNFLEKTSSCLLFNVALGFINFNMVRRTSIGLSNTWDNFREPLDPQQPGDLTMSGLYLMLIIDGFIFMIITWYVDNIYPGDYGVPKDWNFFLSKKYWCKAARTRGKDQPLYRDLDDTRSKYFEKEPRGYQVGIETIKLRRTFGDKLSVNNVTMKMFKGQITVLLGHNGAGKTTTMSMLTGFIPPTDGTAIVNGFNIRRNIDEVRKSLGLCPQHDILVDELTPYEHMTFFADLKGYHSTTLKDEIYTLLSEVKLEEYTNLLVGKLSAGQKRSLSVGIALMGDSKVVILDEPSSGMDPSTRRQTWDVLKKYRKTRTMLLTTHYMDEADALGDRIAIMSEGELQCCGSSMFLKKLYGAGYHMIFVKKPHCNIDKLGQTVISFIDGAFLEYIVRNEVSYMLPDDQCPKFPDFFRHLYDNRAELGIVSFGTKTTTMEEVFLKSEKSYSKEKNPETRRENLPAEQRLKTPLSSNETLNEAIITIDRHLKGINRFIAQFRTMLWKRYTISKRNKYTTAFSTVLPGLFIMMYIFISNATPKRSEIKEMARSYSMNIYTSDNEAIIYTNGAFSALKTSYKEVFPANEGSYEQRFLEIGSDQDLDKYMINKSEKMGTYNYNRNHLVGAAFSLNRVQNQVIGTKATAFFNGDPYHTLFVSLGLVLNVMAREKLDGSYTINFGIDPIVAEGDSTLYALSVDSQRDAFYVGLFVGIGFSFTASLVVFFLLKERNNGVKHLHALFGVSMIGYWLPTLIWDVAFLMIPLCILYAVFILFEKDQFIDDGNWFIIGLVLLLYALSMLPCTYAIHFLFTTPASGLAGVVVLNLFMAVLTNILAFELNGPKGSNPNQGIGFIMDWIFSALVPTYNLSQCFSKISYDAIMNVGCRDYEKGCYEDKPSLCCQNINKTLCTSKIPTSKCFDRMVDYYAWEKGNGIGAYLALMVIQGVLGMIIVVLIETGMTTTCCVRTPKAKTKGSATKPTVIGLSEHSIALRKGPSVDDLDVLREEERVRNLDPTEIPLILVHLTKRYGDKVAIDKVYAGVSQGECFGLLGQSGAGKTTIFRMLTGQTGITSGNAFIEGYSVRTHLNKCQHHIGYCPQYDAHIGELTGVETLTMYAHLSGIPAANIPVLVKGLIEKVLLGSSAERACGHYSGGNRRKLSLAMALVGDPKYLFLDEPSAGMDPKARRQMWNVLSKIRNDGCTIVLTSHSMEECEALCTNLAILLNGRFMCLGSPQHLKTKYGQGYTVIVKLDLSIEEETTGDQVITYLQQYIKNIGVFDQHPGYLHLHIPDSKINIADVFSTMEDCKKEFSLEDYSVLETSLEQIFLSFTKHHLKDEVHVEKAYNCWHMRSGFFDDKSCFKKVKDDNPDQT